MNIKEYEEALRKLTPEELKEFNDNYGGGQLTMVCSIVAAIAAIVAAGIAVLP